jgi:hypothetical protein
VHIGAFYHVLTWQHADVAWVARQEAAVPGNLQVAGQHFKKVKSNSGDCWLCFNKHWRRSLVLVMFPLVH